MRFTCTNTVQEQHRKPIYCVAFNHCDPKLQDHFVTVGSNKATVYRCLPSGAVEVVQCYTDELEAEVFFVCRWSVDLATGAALLLLAGEIGNIRLVDASTQRLAQTYRGHGKSVHDLAVHPTRPHLFLSASKDYSIRLWSSATHTCVAIMKGDGAHTNEVIALDFHPWHEHLFLSSAMDNSVKIWTLEYIWSHVEASDQEQDPDRPPPPKLLPFPVFSSDQLHGNYVDCVRWLGDLVLSKSVDHRIVVWQPIYPADCQLQTSRHFDMVQEFELSQAAMWWVRFSLDLRGGLLACGNGVGKVFLWDPNEQRAAPRATLSHKNCKSVVRQTSVSLGGDMIVASCEDGTIWRWDRGEGAEGSGSGAPSGAAGCSNGAAGVVGGRAAAVAPAM